MSVLPAEAHLLAGRLEDELTVWRTRKPGEFHKFTRQAGMHAMQLCGQMIDVFDGLRADLAAELETYDASRNGGAGRNSG